MSPRILVVEDDATIGRGLQAALEAGGYTVEWVSSGRSALEHSAAVADDLILLDLGLPDLDGIEVCRGLRRLRPGAIIVMLTARREEIDVVVGLDAGADDYLLKPFRLAELFARLRAHLRRPRDEPAGTQPAQVGDLSLDPASRRAQLGGQELDLRPKEFDLLALLVSEAGRVVTRERIMTEVWDDHWFGPTKTLDTHVSSLRRKLGESGEPCSRITTLRGIGYRLEVP